MRARLQVASLLLLSVFSAFAKCLERDSLPKRNAKSVSAPKFQRVRLVSLLDYRRLSSTSLHFTYQSLLNIDLNKHSSQTLSSRVLSLLYGRPCDHGVRMPELVFATPLNTTWKASTIFLHGPCTSGFDNEATIEAERYFKESTDGSLWCLALFFFVGIVPLFTAIRPLPYLSHFLTTLATTL